MSLGGGVFTIGSCFAQHLSDFLSARFYPVAGSPYGIVYHPLAMAEQLRRLLDSESPQADELFPSGELSCHFLFHGSYSQPTADVALQKMAESFESGREALAKAQSVVITLGTSLGYVQGDRVVANCHKLPPTTFDRRLFEAHEIVAALSPVVTRLVDRQVFLTVSPVRHLRDDPTENQISKAHLLIAADRLASTHDHVHYFPAYEIMMDELRDYRFYADDLVHPSDLAAKMIGERFVDWAFTPSDYWQQADALKRQLAHRPLHAETTAATRFHAQATAARVAFAATYPFAEF